MQISIVNGSVEYDGEPVLTKIDFCLRDKERVAIVGRNGCGKTTLFKALTKEVELVKGVGEEDFGFFVTGVPVIGFLKQSVKDDDKTMEEVVLSAYEEILSVEKETEAALRALELNPDEKNTKKYSALSEKFEFLGGYTYKKEYLTAVKKFGFSDGDMKKKISEFSGGQRTKIFLLRLLLSKPDVLLLDEPTNHLDLTAVEWLEKYLADYKKSFVVVSHDRMFLDKTVNVVYEIEYGETTRYNGNYTAFITQKKQNYEKELKDAYYRKKEADRLNALIERFRYKANKAAMAQAKLKQLARLGDLNGPKKSDSATFFSSFRPACEPVKEVFIADKLRFGYDEKKPLGELTLRMQRGQKLGIIGDNGCGKSTLIKTIMKIIPPLSGVCYFGLHVETGYFDQTKTQSFSSLTVLDDFLNDFPELSGTEARTALGAFLFTGVDVFKTVGELSGGEKVRLALCKIFRKRPNFLILDEPTNHMDIIGKDTLEDLLKKYEGTVITVSHDRYFINKICDRLLVFTPDGLTFFEGNYDAYENYLSDTQTQIKETQKTENKTKKGFTTPLKEIDKRERRINKLTNLIDNNDAELSRLNDNLNSPEVFSDYIKITEIQNRIEALKKENDGYTEEWLTLQEELETLKEEYENK